ASFGFTVEDPPYLALPTTFFTLLRSDPLSTACPITSQTVELLRSAFPLHAVERARVRPPCLDHAAPPCMPPSPCSGEGRGEAISNAAWVIRPLVIGRLEVCSSPAIRDRPCAGLGHRRLDS